MPELEFQSEFKNVDMRKACKALSRRRQKNRAFWTSSLGLYVQIAMLLAIAMFARFYLGGELLRALIPLLLIFSISGLILLYSSKAQSYVYEAPIRAGVTKFRLTPEGYHTEHPGYESLMRWSHVPDVLVTDQGLLIVHSDYEYFPIEVNAFRDSEEMEATANQIKKWIAKAKQNQNK